jgi:hypothetical protein
MSKKRAIKDFTEQNMPHNRPEVFKDILTTRFSTLISLGLLLLLFSLPSIIVVLLSNQAIASINKEEKLEAFLKLINTQNLLLIIALLILSIGLAGIYRIIKLLVWQEGFLFWYDFKEGIKQNSKEFLITFLIIGLLNLSGQYIFLNTDIDKAILLILIVVIAFFAPTIVFTLNQSTIYNLSYLGKTKNSFLIGWKNWYTSIPVIILNIMFIILPVFISNPTAYLIVLLVTPLLFGPLLILFNTLYTHHYFDKYINKENFNEIYDKGIVRNE